MLGEFDFQLPIANCRLTKAAVGMLTDDRIGFTYRWKSHRYFSHLYRPLKRTCFSGRNGNPAVKNFFAETFKIA